MTMKSNRLALWAGAAAFTLLAPLAHANLVANGGFETGDLTSWTESGDTSFDGVATGIAHSGNFGFFAGPAGVVTISQSIATVAGQGYLVDFWIELQDSATPNSFSWSWNGVTQAPVITDSGAFPYTEFSMIVEGAAGSSTLAFSFSNPNSFSEMDDVSVTVPEPGTLALIGVAMIGGGVARRRKKLG